MSVNYMTKVYYGYEVHYDEIMKLQEHELNYLENNDLIHTFYAYEEPSWCVIGFEIDWTTAGDYDSFRNLAKLFNTLRNQERRNELDNFFKLAFPDRADNKPDFYFGCEVS